MTTVPSMCLLSYKMNHRKLLLKALSFYISCRNTFQPTHQIATIIDLLSVTKLSLCLFVAVPKAEVETRWLVAYDEESVVVVGTVAVVDNSAEVGIEAIALVANGWTADVIIGVIAKIGPEFFSVVVALTVAGLRIVVISFISVDIVYVFCIIFNGIAVLCGFTAVVEIKYKFAVADGVKMFHVASSMCGIVCAIAKVFVGCIPITEESATAVGVVVEVCNIAVNTVFPRVEVFDNDNESAVDILMSKMTNLKKNVWHVKRMTKIIKTLFKRFSTVV